MGICISCGTDTGIDSNGQCYGCYSNRITTDRWGKPIEWLVEKYKHRPTATPASTVLHKL